MRKRSFYEQQAKDLMEMIPELGQSITIGTTSYGCIGASNAMISVFMPGVELDEYTAAVLVPFGKLRAPGPANQTPVKYEGGNYRVLKSNPNPAFTLLLITSKL